MRKLRLPRYQGSIRFKILVPYVGLLFLAFLVVGLFITSRTSDDLIGQRMEEERTRNVQLATELAPLIAGGDADALYRVALEQNDAQNKSRLLILTKLGTVLVDTHSIYNGMRLSDPAICPEVAQIVDGASEAAGTHDIPRAAPPRLAPVTLFSFLSGASGTERIGYYASVVIYRGERIGIVLRSSSIQDVEDQIMRITNTMVLAILVATAAVIALGFLVSGLLVRPINALSDAMKKTGAGDFTVRAAVTGSDEISRLAATFNMMSEKLENLDRSRSAFISSASHELKTPLASMKILIENLLQMPDNTGITQEFLTDVDHEIDRLNAIIVDLLTLVQTDSGEYRLKSEVIGLEDMLLQVVRRLRPLALRRDIELGLDVGTEPVAVLGDPLKLTQVFYNLVDNAIKYTQESGKVRVELRVEGNKAVVHIRDTGVGIPEADIGHVFDRFYRVDKARSRNTGGTGLGLSIVAETVKMHGGTIEVQSREKQGSVFTVRLPRSKQGGVE